MNRIEKLEFELAAKIEYSEKLGDQELPPDRDGIIRVGLEWERSRLDVIRAIVALERARTAN